MTMMNTIEVPPLRCLSTAEKQQRIQRVQMQKENQVCADCPAKRPMWVSFVNCKGAGCKRLAVLVCDNCAQHHYYELGDKHCHIHSLKMDHEFSLQDVLILEETGNAVINPVLEGELSRKDFDKERVSKNEAKEDERRGKFIKHKYKKHKFIHQIKFRQLMLNLLTQNNKPTAGGSSIWDSGKNRRSKERRASSYYSKDKDSDSRRDRRSRRSSCPSLLDDDDLGSHKSTSSRTTSTSNSHSSSPDLAMETNKEEPTLPPEEAKDNTLPKIPRKPSSVVRQLGDLEEDTNKQQPQPTLLDRRTALRRHRSVTLLNNQNATSTNEEGSTRGPRSEYKRSSSCRELTRNSASSDEAKPQPSPKTDSRFLNRASMRPAPGSRASLRNNRKQSSMNDFLAAAEEVMASNNNPTDSKEALSRLNKINANSTGNLLLQRSSIRPRPSLLRVSSWKNVAGGSTRSLEIAETTGTTASSSSATSAIRPRPSLLRVSSLKNVSSGSARTLSTANTTGTSSSSSSINSADANGNGGRNITTFTKPAAASNNRLQSLANGFLQSTIIAGGCEPTAPMPVGASNGIGQQRPTLARSMSYHKRTVRSIADLEPIGSEAPVVSTMKRSSTELQIQKEPSTQPDRPTMIRSMSYQRRTVRSIATEPETDPSRRSTNTDTAGQTRRGSKTTMTQSRSRRSIAASRSPPRSSLALSRSSSRSSLVSSRSPSRRSLLSSQAADPEEL